MKTKTLLAMGLMAAIGLSGPAIPHGWAAEKNDDQEAKEHHDDHANGELKIPATVGGIFKEIQEYHHHLAETVKNKKLEAVHHLAFAIRDLAKALTDKAPARKKRRVKGTVKNIAKLAERLDASGDAGDQAKTEKNLKKLDGILKVLHAQFGIKRSTKPDGRPPKKHKP